MFWAGSWLVRSCSTSNGTVPAEGWVLGADLDPVMHNIKPFAAVERCAYSGKDVLFTRKLDLMYKDERGNFKQRYQQPYEAQVKAEVLSFLREIQSTKLREIPICRMTQQPVLVECTQKTAFELTVAFRCRSCYP